MIDKTNDKNIEEEGERMIPAFHKGAIVYGEHIVRYKSVENIIKGKKVLDIASGSGYGTKMLSETAREVVGVDVSEDAIDYASRNYSNNNITYKIGSAEKIPVEDKSIDVVISFETIEHIENYEKFLKEIKRVVKKDGIAVISTPNDLEFPEGNHFHLHEFTKDEFNKVLKRYFKHVYFINQYTWYYTALMSDKRANDEFYSEVRTYNASPVDDSKALYFIVVCSDVPVDVGAQINEVGAIAEHFSERSRQFDQARISKEYDDLKRKTDFLVDSADSLRAELDDIYSSKTWKIIDKIHKVKHSLKTKNK